MDHMQNEAMERLRQMYSKTKNNVTNNEKPTSKGNKQEEQSVGKQEHTKPNEKKKPDNLLDILLKDKERSLIVLLLVVLLNEKADSSLILALMYLIL